jgi:hypothetical protein
VLAKQIISREKEKKEAEACRHLPGLHIILGCLKDKLPSVCLYPKIQSAGFYFSSRDEQHISKNRSIKWSGPAIESINAQKEHLASRMPSWCFWWELLAWTPPRRRIRLVSNDIHLPNILALGFVSQCVSLFC